MFKLKRAGVEFVLGNEETSNTTLYFPHGNARIDSTNTILNKGKSYKEIVTKKSTLSIQKSCSNSTG